MFLQLSGFKKGSLLYSPVIERDGLSSRPFIDSNQVLSFFSDG